MIDEKDEINPELLRKRNILKKYNLSRNSCYEFERVILRETKDCQITQIIHYIDVERIRELTLVNNAKTCVIDKPSAEQIAKMINLKVLRLYWVRDVT